MVCKMKAQIQYAVIIALSMLMMLFELRVLWPNWKTLEAPLLVASCMAGLLILNMSILIKLFARLVLKQERTVNYALVLLAEAVIFLPPLIESLTSFALGFITMLVSMYFIKVLMVKANFSPIIQENSSVDKAEL